MKMKTLTISATALALLFLTTTVSANEDRVEARQERIQVRQETAIENKTERAQARQETRSDVAAKHATRLEQRFAGYYKRLSAILLKLQTRVDAITDKDTTTAKAKLSQAKTKLEEAKVLGEKAVSLFKAIDPAKWSEQKSQAVTARDTAKAAHKAFKEAHALMVEAIKSLRSINAK